MQQVGGTCHTEATIRPSIASPRMSVKLIDGGFKNGILVEHSFRGVKYPDVSGQVRHHYTQGDVPCIAMVGTARRAGPSQVSVTVDEV